MSAYCLYEERAFMAEMTDETAFYKGVAIAGELYSSLALDRRSELDALISEMRYGKAAMAGISSNADGQVLCGECQGQW